MFWSILSCILYPPLLLVGITRLREETKWWYDVCFCCTFIFPFPWGLTYYIVDTLSHVHCALYLFFYLSFISVFPQTQNLDNIYHHRLIMMFQQQLCVLHDELLLLFVVSRKCVCMPIHPSIHPSHWISQLNKGITNSVKINE